MDTMLVLDLHIVACLFLNKPAIINVAFIGILVLNIHASAIQIRSLMLSNSVAKRRRWL